MKKQNENDNKMTHLQQSQQSQSEQSDQPQSHSDGSVKNPASKNPASSADTMQALKKKVALLTEESTQLKLKYKELENTAKEWKDKCYMEAANKENLRKTMQKDIEEARIYSSTSIARDIISILEDIEKSNHENNKLLSMLDDLVTNAEVIKSMTPAIQQVGEMNIKNITKLMTNNEIIKIDPANKPFDHNYHQAIKQTASKNHKNGEVVQVLQDGYVMKNRLLRPAMVIVCKND